MLRKALIVTLITVMLGGNFVYAMSMSQFLDQTKNELTSASTFNAYQGQERGYFMGGSARVRVPQETIQPFSFTPPSIKAGCGGIDIVMGGFSYLNFEYLVQKLQSIMQAAPAFAFQLALSSLCPQCANILASLEQLADMINQLNMDSCQASKALVGYTGSLLGKTSADLGNTGSNNEYFSGLRTAISDFNTKVDEFIDKYAGAYDCATAANPVACKKVKGMMSFKIPLLETAFADRQDYQFIKDTLRARVGDIIEETAGDNRKPKYVKPCPNATSIGDAFLLGTATIKTLNKGGDTYTEGVCGEIGSSADGYFNTVNSTLNSILAKIRNKTPLTAQEIGTVNYTSIPVYRILSLIVIVEKVNGDTTALLSQGFIDAVSTPIAYDIALISYDQLLSYITSITQQLRVETVDGNGDLIAVQAFLDDVRSNIERDYEATRQNRMKSYQAMETQIGRLSEHYAELLKTIHTKMAENKLLNSYAWGRGVR